MRVFKRKSGGEQITRVQALKCIPVKNTQIRETRLKTGNVLLSYPARIKPWIAGLIRRLGGVSERTRTKKLQLDAIGTDVWDLMDGKRSVRQIIRTFAEKYQLHPREAEVSVTRFLRELGKRSIIGLK